MRPRIGSLRWLIIDVIPIVFFTTLFNLLRDFGVPVPILLLVFLAIIAAIIFFRTDKGDGDNDDGDIA
jgi:ribose/xylose/arabinose/galactoside ABC-type transport system permease subunit